MTQSPVEYFVGTATIDMTQSDLHIFELWKTSCSVLDVTTTTPIANALPIWFISTQPIPLGIAASGVTYTNILDSVI